MNWLDLVIIAIIVIGVGIGLRIGLLGAAITAAGAFVGWLLAAQFSDDIARLFWEGGFGGPWVTFVAYAVIIILALMVAGLVKGVVLPLLALGTLGISRVVDGLGGLLLGAAIGLALSGALVIALAGFAYNAGLPERGAGGEIVEQIPRDPETRKGVEDALIGSAIVPVCIDMRHALPAQALSFVPPDFKRSLDILEENIERRRTA